ncbi:hypothetical protein [Caulobacter sp. CCG-8]|uniref:hypothetical protein n=1 Tax=Caulobacter sp. CCG-8 TaxID=3127958 RepID=UPI00307D0104
MTASATVPYISYAGAGLTGPYAIPFKFLANADIVVVKVDADGVETNLTGNTITGAGDNAGGTLYTAAAVEVGETLKIYRATARTQTAQYVANGPFPAATHERALDKAMLVSQELDRDVGRAALSPLGEAGQVVPAREDLKGKLLGGDPDTGDLYGVAGGLGGVPASTQGASLVAKTTPTTGRDVLEAVGRDMTDVDADAAPTMGGLSILGAMRIAATFVGDGVTALMGVRHVFTGSSTTTNEIGVNIEMSNSVPVGGGKAYVVGLFAALSAAVGTAAGYCANFVTRSYGPPATVLELNHDALGANSGDGLSDNSVYGVSVWTTILNLICAGAVRLMSGLHIELPPGYTKLLNRGIAIIGDCVRLFAIEDTTSGVAGYKMGGNKVMGMDLTSATFSSGDAIRLPANCYLSWVVGGTVQQVLGAQGTAFDVGYGCNLVNMGATTNPGQNNLFYLGQAGFAWAGITSQTAVTVVSDPRLKVDIETLAPMRALLHEINPRKYRMKVGGLTPYTVMVPGMVPVLDDKGEPIYDEMPDLDAEGNEIWLQPIDPKTRAPRWVRTGFLGLSRKLAPKFLKTKAVMRMVEGEVEETRYAERPGVRLHRGFLSDEVKAAFDRLSEDFGGWVLGQDGFEGLRYEQLTPILWKIVQELDVVIESQATNMAALNARVQALESAPRAS